LPHAQLRALSPCESPAVSRQIGQVCARHEWLCGDDDFGLWFIRWAEEIDVPFAIEQRQGHWIFSATAQEVSWAVFWAPRADSSKRFALLVSRLRAIGQER
jgi:hypothetical protein